MFLGLVRLLESNLAPVRLGTQWDGWSWKSGMDREWKGLEPLRGDTPTPFFVSADDKGLTGGDFRNCRF